jgi:hypothetical protein
LAGSNPPQPTTFLKGIRMETNQQIWILKTGRCPECNEKVALIQDEEYKKVYYCSNTKCLSKWVIGQGVRTPTLFWKILAFWPWFCNDCFNVFLPKDHPWKNKKMNIEDWARKGTDFSMLFSGLI